MATASTTSAPSIGGTIDVNGLVSSLMQVERRPLDLLQQRESVIQAKLSAFGRVQGALSSLQTALGTLQSASTFNSSKATASSDSVTVAAATSAAQGNYSLTIGNLARAQSSASSAFADSSAAVGTGTFTIKHADGSVAAAIDIGGSGQPQSVADLRDAINAANAGVRATLVNDAGGMRLVLTATDTGTKNAFSIETSGSPAAQLAELATPKQTALDAAFTLNGLALTSSSNQLTGVVDGVTINLVKALPAETVSITVSRDADAAKAALNAFVKAYNDAEKMFDDLSKYDPNTRTGAVLNGDSSLRQVQFQLKTLLTASRTAASGEYTRVSQVGLELQADGSFQLNDQKFSAAMAADADKVARLFTATSSTAAEQGFGVRLRGAVNSLLDPQGAVGAREDSLQRSIRDMDQQQQTWEARLAVIEANLRDQYSRLDALVTNGMSQSAALQNALAGLPKQA
jgi:flagellar hook-associated protein 2